MAVKSKATESTKITNRKLVYCSNCDKDKKPSDFYKSYGNTASGLLCYCKDCVITMGLDALGNIDIVKFKEMLMKVDRPYIHQLFASNVEKYGEKGSSTVIGFYFKDLGMMQNRLLRYRDSIFEGDSKIDSAYVNVEEDNILPPEVIKRWGTNYTKEQIRKLENFSKDMQNSYDVKTASHKDYLHKICKVSLKMDEALDNDNIGEFQKLSQVYDTLMKSAKFTAVQRSAIDDMGGFATLSEFIDKLERDGFIEPYGVKEDFDVVEATIADMKRYTKNLVLGDPSIQSMAQESLLRGVDDDVTEEGDE
ncbi:MAG TPA: hypothetical protein K8V90_06435 [Romboutsia timonensis]|uniref:Uncharacterized protein n=1 Tax=Romboutsia timonensis TaxID=1776391 RepID=A0A921N0I8_9FIRM|nr:hypothetical protein [Romboutsia timonensis]